MTFRDSASLNFALPRFREPCDQSQPRTAAALNMTVQAGHPTGKVTDDFGYGDEIARIDLRLVFLRAARPHRPLHPGATGQSVEGLFDNVGICEFPHSHGRDLRRRDLKGHFVLDERDDVKLELEARDFLFLDRHDLTHAVGG